VDAQRIEADGIVSEYKYLPDGGTWDKINYPVVGYFIQMKDDPSSMRLYDSNTRITHPMARVALAWSVSSYEEGKKKFPRPFIFDWRDGDEKKSGQFGSKLVSDGEQLLLFYLEGSIYSPVVHGAIQNLGIPSSTPFLRLEPRNLDRQAERYDNDDYTLEIENDGKGQITYDLTGKTDNNGNITITVKGGESAGRVTLNVNRAVRVNQTDDEGAVQQVIELDRDTQKALIAQYEGGSEVQHIELVPGSGIKLKGKTQDKDELAVYGETLKTLIEELLTALETMTFSNAAGPTGPPNNLASITAIRDTLETILVD